MKISRWQPNLLRLTLCLCCLIPAVASAFSLRDPFDTQSALPTTGIPRQCDKTEQIKNLTLLQAVDVALCRNPETQAAWYRAKASAAVLGQAQSAYLPTVDASASIGRSYNNNDIRRSNNSTNITSNSNYSTSSGEELSLSYLLYDFGGREASVEAARQAMMAAGWNASSSMQSLVFNVIRAYAQIFSATESLEAAKQAEAAGQESFAAAKARYEVGLVTPADTAQAETAFAQNTLDRQKAENALSLAKGNFAALLHLPPSSEFTLAAIDPDAQDNPYKENAEALIKKALDARPDLAAIRAREQQVAADLRLAKTANYPSLALSASASNNDYDSSNESSRHDGNIALRLSIPLFTGFSNSYRIAEAGHSLDAVRADRAKGEDDVALDVWTSYHNFQTAQRTYVTAQTLLKSAQTSQELALGRYKVGTGTLIDALDAQAKLADARSQWVAARYDILITRSDLARALGESNPLKTR